MPTKPSIHWCLLLALLAGLFFPPAAAQAEQSSNRPLLSSDVTAFDLIIAMNTLRVSNGLPALVEDPIIDAVAQGTAEIMAANQMSWHIGNVSGRLASAGYGGGSKVWATENFAVGNQSIDEIMQVWSDPSHMIPALNPAYCNVGAGVAKASNGFTYFVLQAAYTASKSCGEYKSPVGATTKPGGSTTTSERAGGVSQLIVPVKVAEPDAEGKVYHVVQAGQSFWSIAIAYKVTIKDLEVWNNRSSTAGLRIGEKLFIPSADTKGYATPTPVGMIVPATPGPDGKIIHTVAVYQTLSTISEAYGVKMETILALNGWQVDWPLQIGQKLIIDAGHVTPSPTPRPLTPVEKLTPASDGKYYHTIQSGETLSWIASLYGVAVNDLMAWNGLNDTTVIHPDEKLVLQVTPPATITPTPAPATETPTPTLEPPTPTASRTSAAPIATSTPTLAPTVSAASITGNSMLVWYLLGGLGAVGLFLVIFFGRKKVI